MEWRKGIATAAAAVALVGGGTLATATPAQADGTCSSKSLCVWDGTNFSGQRVLTKSTNTCFNIGQFDFGYIRSYDNNLSVNGYVWQLRDGDSGLSYYRDRTLPAGGFSSDIGVDGLGGGLHSWICLGSADLGDYL
ncbi:peptidase inhibitor family I36 protein [Streptomyces antibioticus]|uniref:peptidase inhibitor family I36 protein n=1 Tax=Streptomyces antibioticus TaxID=1890 RepID=UPI0022526F9C|nr:peptidase inhibitor family I36 protein [Streptomyces antibioticus]MCX4739199.1 peptidase inhibitor family I36 protein [Streptomyces antibioticus]